MLIDFLITKGIEAFYSGWIQFGAGFAVAFLIMLMFGRVFIRAMKQWQKKGQPISENLPENHKQKSGTPTMGGILILIAIFVSSLLFMDWTATAGWIALLSLLMFGSIGFVDDYKKIKSQSKKASNGLSPKFRLLIEGVFVIILTYLINLTMGAYVPEYSVALPFTLALPMGLFYYVFAYFVIAGSANATNITDGLDGMLSKLYLPVLVVLLISLYLATRIGFMDSVVFLPYTNTLYPIIGSVFGAILGFLFFNAKPASIFMGDVGSLAIGGFMGTVAMLLRSEVIMGIAAGMMVLILLSSFIQTFVFKITKKADGTGVRVFKRAPLHHHFEEMGWGESKIVDRFFIASIIFSGFALVLLKFA